jgi:hypothetical protein
MDRRLKTLSVSRRINNKVSVGIAQNIKQFKSVCKTRKRGDDDFDYLYGIVTTGWDWHFLLYSPGKISKASDTIKFTKMALEEPERKRVRIKGYRSKK